MIRVKGQHVQAYPQVWIIRVKSQHVQAYPQVWITRVKGQHVQAYPQVWMIRVKGSHMQSVVTIRFYGEIDTKMINKAKRDETKKFY
jgi:hypothetical protein